MKNNQYCDFKININLTLCQNYDAYAKINGFKCWNTCVALNPGFAKHIKNHIKKEYKHEKKLHLQLL